MVERSVQVAERLLRLAAAEGATQAEVVLIEEDSALTRFANGEIHQSVAETNATANLRFVIGKRVGVASSNRLDDGALRGLAARAGEIARVQVENPDFVSLPEPGPVPEVRGAYSASTASASPELRAGGVRAVIAAADAVGVQAYGSFSTAAERLTVANSLGILVEQETTQAQLLTVLLGAEGESGYAETVAVDVSTIDAAAIGREAAGRAHSSRGALELAPGTYPVVLEPYAVVDLVDWTGVLGFSALAVQEGRSFHERGRRIASDLVSICDDGADPDGAPRAFDYEGVGKRRVDLIVSGVCGDVVHDAQTASREGCRSTGHGFTAPNPFGPVPMNCFMAAGASSHEELVGGLDRGLLVTRFHYTNPVHPKRVIVTGMTRDGTFLVESGEIVGPVRNLRFTQSYLDALAGVEAVGRERRLLRGLVGTSLVPGVRLRAFDFTGATDER